MVSAIAICYVFRKPLWCANTVQGYWECDSRCCFHQSGHDIVMGKFCIWTPGLISQHLVIISSYVASGLALVYSLLSRFLGALWWHFSLFCSFYFVIFLH